MADATIYNNFGPGAFKAHMGALIGAAAQPIAKWFVDLQNGFLKLYYFIDWIPQEVWTGESVIIAALIGYYFVWQVPNAPKE